MYRSAGTAVPDIENPFVTSRSYTGCPIQVWRMTKMVSDVPSRVATIVEPSPAYGAAARVKYTRCMVPNGNAAKAARHASAAATVALRAAKPERAETAVPAALAVALVRAVGIAGAMRAARAIWSSVRSIAAMTT